MCGKCIEGCYLAGWRNGAYSFEHMQEDPEFMGLDVMVRPWVCRNSLFARYVN